MNIQLNLSRVTLFFALYQVISAFFMLQILNLIQKIIGNKNLPILVWTAFAVAGSVFTVFAVRFFRNHSPAVILIKLFILVIISFPVLLLAVQISNSTERVHIILFAILGFLAARDNDGERPLFVPLITAAAVCFFVASLDEYFQFWLGYFHNICNFIPERFADFRDITFGTVSGIWGGLLFMIISYRNT